MKQKNLLAAAGLWLMLALGLSAGARAAEYAVGADLSFLPQAEANGTVFKDGGQAKPGLQIFKDHGYNWVRLRLFHTPLTLPNTLAYTIAAAKDAKQRGFKLLLDIHYSDSWADPGHQTTPVAWQGMTHKQLVQAVFAYTRDTLEAFRSAGALPDMVEVGNEITAGMLWPDGKLPGNWDHLADLLKSGIKGVDAGCGNGPKPRIMLHIDRGGDQKTTQWFFDQVNHSRIRYDVIGQSFYPWWHGSLLDLRQNLAFMATTYKKDIIVVEAAYCWQPSQYRMRSGPFPETPDGQAAFLDEVNRLVMAAPEGRGKGVFWWEPAVAPETHLRNRGMFDDDGNALPALSALDRFTLR
jgi:arabinogalactan endo-1,4-beta-galactosidase